MVCHSQGLNLYAWWMTIVAYWVIIVCTLKHSKYMHSANSKAGFWQTFFYEFLPLMAIAAYRRGSASLQVGQRLSFNIDFNYRKPRKKFLDYHSKQV